MGGKQIPWSHGECWFCRAAADPAALHTARLYAPTTPRLDSLGYAIRQRADVTEVAVPVPRCRDCRARMRSAVVTVFAWSIGGLILVPVLWAHFGGQGGARPWWSGGEDADHLMVGAGAVLGFVGAVIAIAVNRRRLGLRALNDFPPLAALRGIGWQWSND
jgi:hypothetical protein